LRLDSGYTYGVEFEKVTDTIESHRNADANKLSTRYHGREDDVEPTVGETYTVKVDWGTDGRLAYRITDAGGDRLCADEEPVDGEFRSGGIGFVASSSDEDSEENVARFERVAIE
jgi:hypothetical protein